MWVVVEKEGKQSLIEQVYTQIRNHIWSGVLKAGDNLPSTRKLADMLKVSRNVVLEAYDLLKVEGYIEAIHGSGTKVAQGGMWQINPEKRVEVSQINIKKQSKKKLIDFKSGRPNLEAFPKKQWGRMLYEVYQDADMELFGYQSSKGQYALREALVDYLLKQRGIACQSSQIIITSGATQAIHLVSRLLYQQEKVAVVEEPTHYGIVATIQSLGYTLMPIAVDEKGLDTQKLPQAEDVGLVYVTPSHQFPLGGIMPIQRRKELIAFAKEKKCFVLEDDYDSEFRYQGHPIHTLYELAPSQVIYIGSFSKCLAPSIRIGYVILPEALINKAIELKMYNDVHGEPAKELVLARFIREGKLETHIWKMKKEYSKKRQVLLEALEAELLGEYEIKGANAGLHLVVRIKGHVFTKVKLQKIEEEGVKIYALTDYMIQSKGYEDHILLGYGHLTPEEIKQGVHQLKKCLIAMT